MRSSDSASWSNTLVLSAKCENASSLKSQVTNVDENDAAPKCEREALLSRPLPAASKLLSETHNGRPSLWCSFFHAPILSEHYMYNHAIFSFFLCALSASAACAQQREIVRLWPGDVPGEFELSEEFRSQVLVAEAKNVADRVFGVSSPTMTVYKASAERANGTAVLVCPGGGYNQLAWGHEGHDVAEWLNSIGVHAFVLTYRVPRRPGDFTLPPLQDAQRALRVVRSRAAEMQFDAGRVGVLGFSAGGNLTVNAATRFDEGTYKAVDETDRLSCRPDFAIPIYAAYLGQSDDDKKLNPELKINRQTPPMFMAVTQDDKNRGLHAALLFAELTRAGVKSEVHVYTKGGHGYGMRVSNNAVSQWPARCADWMQGMDLLTVSP
jgi:acetyl esterase/lipase